MRRLLIDTDTGSDDAVALVLALKHPNTKVEAITTVAGNVPLAMATQNALYTVELCGSEVGVFEGLAKPLLRPLETAQFVHGQDGMGDIGLSLQGRVPALGHAVDKILEVFNGAPDEIDLITLGPLSNIAVALLRDPSLISKIRHCYIMGGTSDNFGNMSFAGEFNMYADPEAAKIVFESGLAITMIGWDISRKYAVFNPEDIADLKAINTPLAHYCVDIQAVLQQYALTETGLAGFDLPDPIAMAIALDPSIATVSKSYFVTVETSHGQARGQTLLDHLNLSKRPANTNVVFEADRTKFLGLLHRALQTV
jgi:purine nucleosidase